MDPDPGSAKIREAFEKLLLADRAHGPARPLETYQRIFAGHESLIAAAFAELVPERAAPVPAPVSVPALLVDGTLPAGTLLGHYEILELLGRGGQGAVYLARDVRLARKAALKVLSGAALDSKPAVQRFWREGELASKLVHPCICEVYESGVEEGLPFLAMRHVEGVTFLEWVRHEARGRSDRETSRAHSQLWVERILLFVEQVGQALAYAHEKGVLHRDIKPSNIMVTHDGSPVVLDFGLAKDFTGEGPTLTEAGAVFGTPAYMSPEQATRPDVELDERTDVYSLGTVLYEALTLRRPFEDVSQLELFSASQRPKLELDLEPVRGVSRDLKVVLQTATAGHRGDRYRTARDFAEDLRRVRLRLPIHARKVGTHVQFYRWVQRSPVVAGLTLALFATLVAGLLVSLRFLGEARSASRESTWRAYVSGLGLADSLLRDGNVVAALEQLDAQPPRLRGWEWRFLAAGASQGSRVWSGAPGRAALRVVDGELVGFHADGTATARGLEPDAPGARRYGSPGAIWTSVASTSGRTHLTVLRGQPGATIRITRTATGELLHELPAPFAPPVLGWTAPIVWDEASGLLVLGGPDGVLHWWRPGEQGFRAWDVGVRGFVSHLALDAAGERVAVAKLPEAEYRTLLLVVDLDARRVDARLDCDERFVNALAFSADGQRVFAATGLAEAGLSDATLGERVEAWSVSGAERLAALPLSGGQVRCLATSPRNELVCAGLDDGTIRVLDGGLTAELGRLRGHRAPLEALVLADGGRRLYSVAADGEALGWRPEDAASAHGFDAGPHPVESLALSADGTLLAAGGAGDVLRVFDLAQESVREYPRVGSHVRLAFGPASRELSFVGRMAVERWGRLDLASGAVREIPRRDAHLSTTVALPDPEHGRWFVQQSWEDERGAHHLNLLEVSADGEPVARLEGLSEFVRELQVSPDGALLVACTESGVLHAWELATRRARELTAPDGALALAFAPDSRTLALGLEGARLCLLDLESGRVLDAPAFGSEVRALAFSRDGTRIAVGTEDANVRLVDAATLSPVFSLPVLPTHATVLVFGGSSDSLVAGCKSGDVVVWSAVPPRAARGTKDPGLLPELASVAERLAAPFDLGSPFYLNRKGPESLLAPFQPREWSDVVADAARRLAAQSEEPAAQVTLGIAMYRAGRLDEAREALESGARLARERGAEEPRAAAFLAATLARAGELDAARAALQASDSASSSAGDRMAWDEARLLIDDPAGPAAFDAVAEAHRRELASARVRAACEDGTYTTGTAWCRWAALGRTGASVLHDFAWLFVTDPRLAPDQYAAALEWARAAHVELPCDLYTVTLGGALMRTGADAAATRVLDGAAPGALPLTVRHPLAAAYAACAYATLDEPRRARALYDRALLASHSLAYRRSIELRLLVEEVERRLARRD